MTSRRVLPVVLVSLMGARAAIAQVPPCGIASRPAHYAPFPAGVVRAMRAPQIDTLRCLLRRGDLADVPRYYFGAAYTPDLPDLVVYIDRTGRVRQALVHDDRVVPDTVLRDEKNLYISVFSDVAPGGEEGTPGYNTVAITRTSIDYERDPFLTRLLNAIGGLLPKDIGAAPRDSRADSMVTPKAQPLGRGTDSTVLYLAFHKFGLAQNSWDRITVSPPAGGQLPDTRSIVMNFANSAMTRFGVSLSLGLTLNAQTDSAAVSRGQPVALNVFVLGHYFIRRPALPRLRTTVSIVAGTNLKTDVFSEILTGIAVDRLWGDVGLVAAANFRPAKRADGTSYRAAHPFVGLTFQL